MTNDLTPVDWATRPIMEKYADFSGRAPRPEDWWYILGVGIAGVDLSRVESILRLRGGGFGG